MRQCFAATGMGDQDVDFLVPQGFLPFGFEDDGGGQVLFDGLAAVDQEVDVAATGVVVGARAGKPGAGGRAEALGDGLADEPSLLRGWAHKAGRRSRACTA